MRLLRTLAALERMTLEVNRTLDWRLLYSGGLAEGEVLAGHILCGSDPGPTLIGQTPILAARLCAQAGAGDILATAAFAKSHRDDFRFEPVPAPAEPPCCRLVLA